MYPQAYIRYLVHFHGDHDYFECHEILEEHWKKSGENKQSIMVAFILLAVSNYHYRRNNVQGAMKTLLKAVKIFHKQKVKGNLLGVEMDVLLPFLEERTRQIRLGTPYSSFVLPLSDSILAEKCKKICESQGLSWGGADETIGRDIIDKHLRDFSSIRQKRHQALSSKHQQRKRTENK